MLKYYLENNHSDSLVCLAICIKNCNNNNNGSNGNSIVLNENKMIEMYPKYCFTFGSLLFLCFTVFGICYFGV